MIKRNKKALKQVKKSQRLEDYESAMLMLRLADMDGLGRFLSGILGWLKRSLNE